MTPTLPEWVRAAPIRLFFGGSFNPPHEGHTTLPARVADRLGDRTPVVYVPASRSPHKDDAPAPDADRLAMLELALGILEHPHCVWTRELDTGADAPGAPSYWADTWSRVRAVCGASENRFLIGADQALSMHKWRRFAEFWRDAAVMLRDDVSHADDLLRSLRELGVWSEEDLSHWASRIVRVGMVDASSSHIRAALSDPEKRKHPIDGLDDRVRGYIVSRGLYTRGA